MSLSYRCRVVLFAFAFLFTACSQPSAPTGDQASAAEEPAGHGHAPGEEHDGPGEMAGAEPTVHTHADGTVHEHLPADDMMAGHDAAHQDHDPKHGGTFFMSLDGHYHLEGVLVDPGIFRVYLYDEYTQEVSREALEGSEARVIWGKQDGAPEIVMELAESEVAFEASAPGAMRFPVTLTLMVNFSGSRPGARAEVFTFPFSHFNHEPNHQH